MLKKEPMGKDISESDVFSFNEEFHNKLYKIKIATVSAQKESEPEKQETRHNMCQLTFLLTDVYAIFCMLLGH